MSLSRYQAFIIVFLLLGSSIELLATAYWTSIHSMLGLLFTRHNIKGGVALLTPVVIGLATVYIAWQQHLLGRSQAKISQDQRDIAHNKQRIELFEKVYEIYETLEETYRAIFMMRYSIPPNKPLISGLIFFTVWERDPYENSKKYKSWHLKHIDEKKKIEELLGDCREISQRARFMFDSSSVNAIKTFVEKVSGAFYLKLDCIEEALRWGPDNGRPKELRSEARDLDRSMSNAMKAVSRSMKPYLTISDITRQEALSDLD